MPGNLLTDNSKTVKVSPNVPTQLLTTQFPSMINLIQCRGTHPEFTGLVPQAEESECSQARLIKCCLADFIGKKVTCSNFSLSLSHIFVQFLRRTKAVAKLYTCAAIFFLPA